MVRSIAVLLLLSSSAVAQDSGDAQARRLAAQVQSKEAEIRLLEEQVDRLTRLVRLLRYPVESTAAEPVYGLIGGGLVARPPVEGRVLGVSSLGLVRVSLGEASGLKPGNRLTVSTGGWVRILRVEARDSVGEYQSSDESPLPAVSATVRWLR